MITAIALLEPLGLLAAWLQYPGSVLLLGGIAAVLVVALAMGTALTRALAGTVVWIASICGVVGSCAGFVVAVSSEITTARHILWGVRALLRVP